MNKTAIKNVATYARKELISQVALRAQSFGITPKSLGEIEVGSDYVIINSQRYPKSFERPYKTLQKEIEKKGFQQVIEGVAYTWFNRFVALHFMEVNDYLPSKIRVLSSQTPGKVDPDILTMYRELDFPFEESFVQERLTKGDNEAAFRHLLIAQCNQLSRIMSFLFERINDYTELLMPAPLLHTDSVISRLVNDIDEDDFREVEIIGWMYQYYISEKQKQIVGMNKGIVVKEDLPAATQLFTPKWIVQYMVQNSLGKLWHDHNPDSSLIEKWEYYLHAKSKSVSASEYLELESIKILDPACGSGHILVYAFDLLYDMYESQGYPAREIPALILTQNLYGLDIDKRAAQLAGFALLMKARSKDRRLFRQEIKLNIYDFKDAEKISNEALEYFCKNENEIKEIKELVKQFSNAKSFGSLIVPPDLDYEDYLRRLEGLDEGVEDLFERRKVEELKEKLIPLFTQVSILSKKYHVVVTNPPYHNKYNTEMKKFIQEHYADYKADLYSAFIYRCTRMTLPYGYCGMMSPFTWMFINAHEELRLHIIQSQCISSLIQLEYSAFEEATVPICTFVIQNQQNSTLGQFIRLTDFRGSDAQPVKVREAVLNPNVSYRYICDSKNFIDINGSPIAFWMSKQVKKIFKENPSIGDISESRLGMATANNERFLRLWYEVPILKIGYGIKNREKASKSKFKWFPYQKGGEYRKWYGNNEYVVNWENDGFEIRNFKDDHGKVRSHNYNLDYIFREGITWSDVSSSNFGVRYMPSGYLFDAKGSCLFLHGDIIYIVLAYLCSCLAENFLRMLNSTISFQVGNVKSLPFLNILINNNTVYNLSVQNISLAKNDWNSFETSWDFELHPFLTYQKDTCLINQAFQNWVDHADVQFRQLQANEEELNRIFIKIYGLEDELTPEVPDEEITVRRADRERDAKSFLSYAVGCMMGRYSLDVPGLAYAGGEFDSSKYQRFLPDPDGILPITDKSYFDDDIMDRLAEFLKITFGEETLQENLYWLAESLTMKNNETPVERLRRYFMEEFYKDHLKIYQKRPIYWLFDSGRKKGFRALVYLHRYNPQTLAKMRLDYLQEMQVKYTNEEQLLLQRLEQPDLSRAEKTATNKRLEEVRGRQRELIDYDKLLADYANQRVALDLDDGVVANYTKLQPLLAVIR